MDPLRCDACDGSGDCRPCLDPFVSHDSTDCDGYCALCNGTGELAESGCIVLDYDHPEVRE